MKENRIGMLISGCVAILSLIASICFTCYNLGWGINFSFSLFGSSVLSFIICLVNYLVFRKKMIADLVNGLYRYNNEATAQLYTLSKNIEIENMSLVIGVACSHLNNLIFLAFNIKNGLLKAEKDKRKILDKIIENLEGDIQFKFNSIGEYLLKRPKKAEKIKAYLYKIIDKLLNDKKAYNLAIKLAKTVNTGAKTVEETFEMPQKKFESFSCDLLEKEIKLMQLKDELKNKKQQLKSKKTTK